jgi:S1-C subfamily serine protease
MLPRIAIILILSYVFMFGLWSEPVSAPFTVNTDPETIEIVTVATSTEKVVTEKPKEVTMPVAKKVATTTKPASVNIPQKTPVVPPPPTPIEPEPNYEQINTTARLSTVNILCTAKNNDLSPISGTGIVISSSGLILTNAHVAQYLLLKDLYQKDFISCVIRNGSPAYPRYNVELVYISPLWVESNKKEIKSQNPQGTGENDYAFLRITSGIDGSALPTFPYLPINIREKIDLGEPVVLVSYPAGFLGGLSILQGLSITSAITKIQDIFTFKDGTIDVIDVGGTVVSQKGASGGAVVDRKTSLLGIISTSTNGDTTSSRGLNAITLSYINKTLKNEAGVTISELISSNLAVFAKNFQENNAIGLTKILTKEITKNQ